MIIGECDGLPYVYLMSEEVWFTGKPTIVSTVLGSCVSVTMFARHVRFAAICHAILPVCAKMGTCPATCGKQYKYVNCVIPKMVQRFQKHDIRPRDLEVNLFGGADMPGSGRTGDRVGQLNTQTAIGAIKSEKLRLKASDVGGFLGRKIYFHTHTGEILLKRLKR